jgi:quinone-modifying oxidoreductase subunit QmoC
MGMTDTETVETAEKAEAAERAEKVEKIIQPDLQFVKEVVASGGESLKKCYQCATCTVVCNVTPDDNPFPRKEMVQAQWGLKDELFRNPDIWLCHHCSDCTAYCPRGAKPGEVLNSIRKMSIAQFSTPSFLAKMVGTPAGLLFLLALPIVVLLGLISAFGNLPSKLPLGDKVVYHEFAPTLLAIDLPFTLAFAFAVVMLAMGVKRYWTAMSEGAKPQGSVSAAVVDTIKDILAHTKFDQCDLTPKRKTSHMLLLYSFIALAVTTGIGFIREWGPVIGIEAEHPLYIPMKIIGNAGAIALVLGVVIVILNRFAKAAQLGLGSYYDWLLITVISFIAATGVLAELMRLGNLAPASYWVYFTHLVAVFFLFAYAPYSKMAHMVYRATAMVHSRMTGRNGS